MHRLIDTTPLTLHGAGSTRGAGIYAIRHLPSGRVYVGGALSIGARCRSHLVDLSLERHHNRLLQAAWREQGAAAAAFEFVVLELVSKKSALHVREQHYIDTLGAHVSRGGFNLAPFAGRHLGCPQTERGKELLSIARMGRRASPDERAQMSVTRRALWQEPTYRSKMLAKRAKKRGVRLTPEHCEKMSRALRGKKRTPEQCERNRAAQLRYPQTFSAERRAKLAAAGTGRVQSEETRQKKRLAMLQHVARKTRAA